MLQSLRLFCAAVMDFFRKPSYPAQPIPSEGQATVNLLSSLLIRVDNLCARQDAVERVLGDILCVVKKLERYNMALPEIVETAIATEVAEGMKVVEANQALQAKVAELEALLAGTPTPGVGQAIVDIKELADRIASINPTPVSDAIVSEVINNPEIETPAIVESAPEVAPEVIQEPAVVEAALEAIVSSDAAEA